MEEINAARVSRQASNQEIPIRSGRPSRNKSRYAVDEGGDLFECSGKHCRSCTAGLIADCVALCCCPCSLLNLFTLAFVKVPWMIGRRFLGRAKRRSKYNKRNEGEGRDSNNNNNKKKNVVEREEELIATVFGEEDEEMANVISSRFELVAERVWSELYEIGHLDFGRVSFTGIL